MNGRATWLRGLFLLIVVAACVAGASTTAGATSAAQFQGTLADGGTWIADVPPN